jgi:signal peptidase I
VSQRPALGCLFEILETLVLTVVIFWLIQTFVAQPFKVQQGSMERTLEEGQYVLVDKLTPRWEKYALGDIVVFQPPPSWTDAHIPYIKRVIGTEGDTVELKDGKVFLNGTALDESYLYMVDGEPQPTEPTPGGQTRWVIGAGQLFVMGDHRGNSSDSRTFGPIEVSSVAGRAWLRYWPFDAFTILQHPTYPNTEALGAGASP